GDNTRGALQVAAKGDKAKTKFIVTARPSGAFEKRKWNDFLFAKEKKEPAKSVELQKFLPEAPHIAMAACESNQSAIEYGGEGVFTKNLLGVLRHAKGNISYKTLASRLSQLM